MFAAAVTGFVAMAPIRGAGPAIEFNRDVRPILAENCYACHGPDAAQRKAKLRLDTEAGALADLGGRRAIVPGDVESSELLYRVEAEETSERMPPASTGRTLTAEQLGVLRRWIEQGAKWESHWSLIPTKRPMPPSVKDRIWPRNPIDSFILERLERDGLTPSAEADRTTLIRRVTLDLTGLPPTPAEVDAFLEDRTPFAYEALVDRLLASPRYGEHMALRWLEAARYADTNGYQSDGERFMWRWRDWVVGALNGNMPFDRFTIEQLAGDLLPEATLDQRIATGFNRNHRGNAEGGIIPEEYAVEYVADRVETTATVWMGLTLGCARCHDHKFDPISQKDFYRTFAIFNNVPEKGRAVKFGNSPPMIKAPTPDQQARLAALDGRLADAERRFTERGVELAGAQAAWECRLASARESNDWANTENLLGHFPLDGASCDPKAGSFRAGEPAFVAGRHGQAAAFDGLRFLDAGDVGSFGFDDKFSLAAWIRCEDGQGGTILSRMTDAPQADGYAMVLEGGKLQANFVKRWLDDSLRVETERALEPGRWHHLLVSYDGSRVAGGVRVYIDGRPEPIRALLDELNQSFKTNEPLRIGAGNGPEGRFRGLIDDVRVFGEVCTPADAAVIATPATIAEIAAIPAAQRSEGQALKLRACFLAEHAPGSVRRAWREVVALRRQRERLIEGFPTTMVMQESPTPRETFVLVRGQYDQHGEPVAAGVPGCLPQLGDREANRLGFARWLVDPSHPLTARVAVNRAWQALFGAGLVKTTEDFGTRGSWPSHPELLDWLASEFVRLGWDVKSIHRLIVTSATYRQSSRSTPERQLQDPENRLLSRGPRLRLSAAQIRDQALAAGGLLFERLGGPSVKPYQPEGLWRELAEVKDYVQDHGPDLYRRGLYTFWKRTVPPPSMTAFDAPSRETCAVRESRTNTPLQALTLLNDVTFVEAARAVAQRVMVEGGSTAEDRLTFAFRLATARRPTPEERRVLLAGYTRHLAHYRADPRAANALVRVGEAPGLDGLDPAELAATMVVAHLILNLDEAITRE
jgi:hypothetical protein